jgi:hypothetical protein
MEGIWRVYRGYPEPPEETLSENIFLQSSDHPLLVIAIVLVMLTPLLSESESHSYA